MIEAHEASYGHFFTYKSWMHFIWDTLYTKLLHNIFLQYLYNIFPTLFGQYLDNLYSNYASVICALQIFYGASEASNVASAAGRCQLVKIKEEEMEERRILIEFT